MTPTTPLTVIATTPATLIPKMISPIEYDPPNNANVCEIFPMNYKCNRKVYLIGMEKFPFFPDTPLLLCTSFFYY